ncbi:hypothetical protein [Aneurinibacillus tyrosinisolvens]|uniref:hypothetical protein n=1 Tax=Aneurinibacillus tyrosinisolvens TaxID=1443435 RepID=UPI00063F1C5D|nr:hypothetical protein [Aneurinibacillus tyrosinisolvens]
MKRKSLKKGVAVLLSSLALTPLLLMNAAPASAAISNKNTWLYSTNKGGNTPLTFNIYSTYSESVTQDASVNAMYFNVKKAYVEFYHGLAYPFGGPFTESSYTNYYSDGVLRGTLRQFVPSSESVLVAADSAYWNLINNTQAKLALNSTNKTVEHVDSLDLGTGFYPRIFSPTFTFKL